MHCKKPLSAAITCVLLMLAGCDRTIESRNYRLNISPSLGKIQNADVFINSANGGALLGKGKTRELGSLGLRPLNSLDPAYITVQPTGSTVYFDEELGETSLGIVSLPANSPVRAIVPYVTGSYGVTPFTELAYRIAEDQGLFPLTLKEVNIINGAISDALTPEIDSILVPPTIIDAETEFCKDPVKVVDGKKECNGKKIDNLLMNDTPANRYALRIAALVKMGASAGSLPAVSIMNALGSDILDGKIDGLDKNGNAVNTPYSPATFENDFETALKVVAKNYANNDFENIVKKNLDDTKPWGVKKSILTDPASIDDGSYYSGCKKLAAGVAPALPPGIAGQIVDMIFSSTDIEAPFSNGESVRFTFCNDGQLRIGNDYHVVSSTFKTSAPGAAETTFTWTQAASSLQYELVVNSGAIYEVNVLGSNGSYYYGQFQQPVAPVRDNCLRILGISLICFR